MVRRPSPPWLLVAIGTGFALLSGWSFYLAARGTSAVVDRDYYSHGLRYNQTLLERQAAVSLGWQLAVSHEGQQLLAILSDSDGRMVSGAQGQASLLGGGRSGPLLLPFGEEAPGRYRLDLPAGLSGELTVDLAFAREGAHLQRRLLLVIPRS